MKISSVICEFNPIHNGHEYLLRKMREGGATHIVAIMSGNFTQRGEAAIFDKFTRASAALECGADLVIELPVSFACSNAERFAYGGVYIADALGCIEELSFGSETADTLLLKKAADAVSSVKTEPELSRYLSTGMTFAAARQKAVEAVFGREAAEILSQPNDILAVEYIKALNKLGSAVSPSAVKRIGAGHDSFRAEGKTASARKIRESYYRGDMSCMDYIPSHAADIFRNARNQPCCSGRMSRLEPMMLYRLRTMTAGDIARLPEISEGLENRIYEAVRSGTSISQITDKAKSKRYTRARISRIMTYALLGIEKQELPDAPEYIRILGMNSRGREILRHARGRSTLPVIMRYADIEQGSGAEKMFIKESVCDDIYALSGMETDICGRNYTAGIRMKLSD